MTDELKPIDAKRDAKRLAELTRKILDNFETLDFGTAVKNIDLALDVEAMVEKEEKELKKEEKEIKEKKTETKEVKKDHEEKKDINKIASKTEWDIDEFLELVNYEGYDDTYLKRLLIKKSIKHKNKSFEIQEFHNKHVVLKGLEAIQHVPHLRAGWIPCEKNMLKRVLDFATETVIEKMQHKVSTRELVRYVHELLAKKVKDKDIECNIKDHVVFYEGHKAVVDGYLSNHVHFDGFPPKTWVPLIPAAINQAVVVLPSLKRMNEILEHYQPYKMTSIQNVLEGHAPNGNHMDENLIKSLPAMTDNKITTDMVHYLINIHNLFNILSK
ncbi:hypothetical protein HOK51_04025 [Candidatus Woesearchaeota archaeon]|jgi:hypothetical protein|nr:hypothetical protein [Candidatus Woesearchaeota archaeon]MBT6518989.1 hypothetical protein [Candidatus Woesearchaeota archaeon]MBT7368354.1 hypothetical protein [Candidatus Woesearchaeota archaeon]